MYVFVCIFMNVCMGMDMHRVNICLIHACFISVSASSIQLVSILTSTDLHHNHYFHPFPYYNMQITFLIILLFN